MCQDILVIHLSTILNCVREAAKKITVFFSGTPTKRGGGLRAWLLKKRPFLEALKKFWKKDQNKTVIFVVASLSKPDLCQNNAVHILSCSSRRTEMNDALDSGVAVQPRFVKAGGPLYLLYVQEVVTHFIQQLTI